MDKAVIFNVAAYNQENDCIEYAQNSGNLPFVLLALRIRAVETSLYQAFGRGLLHGTIHTCVGQEFTGALICSKLQADDFVTSNHRCHGHFIATTGDWRGLVDEIVGNRDGVCAGIGSSQHLCADRFISNGQQGGLMPVAAGVALERKHAEKRAVVVSFIGEGTLGEGAVYETLNLTSLWGLPHLVVCENNGYSQSTPQSASVAGHIDLRAEAFGIRVFKADTWNLGALAETAEAALGYVRDMQRPAMLVIQTYRLNPHSKGDDSRDSAEIEWFAERDPLNVMLREAPDLASANAEILREVDAYLSIALQKPKLSIEEYGADQLPRVGEPTRWAHVAAAAGERGVQQLNSFYRDWLAKDPGAFFLGEDIADPYGGAFKVSKGVTTQFPDRALTTPISESAIVGVGIGLAICGRRSLVEIMFGDFILLALDQIINNASKFHHMYNRKLSCPVVVRTPMGGRRGYGPTHSQSFERFLLGIDNCCLISTNSLVPVRTQLEGLKSLMCPAVVAENKIDYANRDFVPDAAYAVECDDAPFPTVRVAPVNARPNLTIVSYGGMARFVADCLVELFEEGDAICELIAPVALHPFDARPVRESVRRTRRLLVVEEGSTTGGFGAEVLARIAELEEGPVRSARIGCAPVPTPSVTSLESDALPSVASLIRASLSLLAA